MTANRQQHIVHRATDHSMGLDTSHNAWHGSYGMFNNWRVWVARQAGLPLHLMDGFYRWEWEDGDREKISQSFKALWDLAGNDSWLETIKPMQQLGGPIKWDLIGDHPLRTLLHHSDCEGRIRWWECKGIALELGKILRRVKDDTKEVTYTAGPNAGERMYSSWRDGRGTYDGNVPATKRFICGCLDAWKKREDLIFR